MINLFAGKALDSSHPQEFAFSSKITTKKTPIIPSQICGFLPELSIFSTLETFYWCIALIGLEIINVLQLAVM